MFAKKDALFMPALDFLTLSRYDSGWRDHCDYREWHAHYFKSFSECL